MPRRRALPLPPRCPAFRPSAAFAVRLPYVRRLWLLPCLGRVAFPYAASRAGPLRPAPSAACCAPFLAGGVA
ncbi:hypothetical protein, partial [Streptomyces violascens]|uniref:hypothetical protein n=1 Tax=Streptomyces violascens TaxID=67381 RepID=UPI001E2ABAA4